MDLNADGYLDIITGQYHPGDVTWFRGSETGFLPGIKLDQEGDPASNGNSFRPSEDDDEIHQFSYWNYSAASFGDFDGDGDYDLIVGGKALRISENIGTKTNPKFSRRRLLLDIHGDPLKTRELSQEEIKRAERFGGASPAGSFKTSPFVVDWDNDGVLDLLATDDYRSDKSLAVAFFRGVKTQAGHRFEPGVDLLKTADGSKALPGSSQRVYVDDWNKDGVKDLIIGASIVTVRGKFHEKFSWTFEDVTRIESAGKDPGHPPGEDLKPEPLEEYIKNELARFRERGFPEPTREELKKRYQQQVDWYEGKLREQADPNTPDERIFRHQGRVYVLFGNTGAPSTSESVPKDQLESSAVASGSEHDQSESHSPLTHTLDKTLNAKAGETVKLKVTFDVAEGWYFYAPTGANERQGMKETKVVFDLPEGFDLVDFKMPLAVDKGSFQILDGKGIDFVHSVKVGDQVKSGRYTIAGEIHYQICNQGMCLPPDVRKISLVIEVR